MKTCCHTASSSERDNAPRLPRTKHLAWPRIDLAAKLVLDHRGTWDGRHYGMLVPAAGALEHDHPAAATVLYRALIDDILARARSPAYGHAARYLAKLEAMSVGEI